MMRIEIDDQGGGVKAGRGGEVITDDEISLLF